MARKHQQGAGRGGWIDLQLTPIRHLEPVEGHADRWRVKGNDPGFSCEGDCFPLPRGWYKLELDFELHSGPAVSAAVYPVYGEGASVEAQGLPLPLLETAPGRCSGLVCFSNTVHALRFDPAVQPCEFSLSSMRIRRVGKITAGRYMLHAITEKSATRAQRLDTGMQALRRLGRGGPSALAHWLHTRYTANDAYATWLNLYDLMTPERLSAAREESARLSRQPLFSIVMPTYNTDENWLRRCIDSVQAQAYPNWELCIADDASKKPHVMRVLAAYAKADVRVKVKSRASNGHISATSNTALELATGDYIVLLDHDDELHPLALFEVAKALNAHPEWKVLYSDEDKIDQNSRRYDPYMKPDWNYDLFLSHNCISHLGVYERQLVRELGGFREGYEGSQDWDLALRCVEAAGPQGIGHIPKVLYHWRAIPGSTALAVGEKNYAHDAGLKAVGDHLRRIGVNATVEEMDGRPGNFRTRYRVPEPAPLVSLIIPTRNGVHLLRRCVESILQLTTYDNYEIVIVDNQSDEAQTLVYLREIAQDPRVRVIEYDKPFNYSALNNEAVAQTNGTVVGLVNNDIEVITPDWLQEMVGHAMRPQIGAVGAMLYYPNDTIQHAGVILGVHGVAAHAYCGSPRGYPGAMGRASLTQSMSAVTAACMLIRREVYEEVGGLNESLRVAFNDVDFCLRVRQAGYRNLWTPFAELYHHESATRGYEDSPEKQKRFLSEVEFMQAEWHDELAADPAYSVNFTLTDAPFELAFPPRDAD